MVSPAAAPRQPTLGAPAFGPGPGRAGGFVYTGIFCPLRARKEGRKSKREPGGEGSVVVAVTPLRSLPPA